MIIVALYVIFIIIVEISYSLSLRCSSTLNLFYAVWNP